ncbi:MAG: S8 family peptidase [Myxococcaceae bacterium]|nr:S8 family peptidase [Myxococcaceae bacterium]
MHAHAAATEALSSPVPEFEALLSSKTWPRHLSPQLAVVYRAALAASARREVDAVAGVTVRQPYLRTRLRFTRDVAHDDVAALESRGCRVVQLPSGAPARVGPVIDADCTWRSLSRLVELPALLRVSPTLGLTPPSPLAPPVTTTLDEVEVTAWRQAQLTADAPGQGVTVLDVDTAVDLFHPYLLRADGGRFAWLDVNGDGAFTPELDAVDLNGDGTAELAETLRVHKAPVRLTHRDTSMNTYFNTDPAFEVGVDWLYADANGNRLRDLAKDFDEARAGYGESLFVVDDVNANHVLDPGEKLVRLGTSKVKAVLDFDSNKMPRVWTRGENLLHFTAPASETAHATMVLGTLAGGHERFTRYRGAAPAADVLLAYRSDEPTFLPSLAWGEEQHAHLTLWEMAQWYWAPLDGSSDLEAACDSAHGRGMLQLGAAGNLGGSGKHRVSTVTSAGETFGLSVPVANSRGLLFNFNFPAAALGTLTFKVNWGAESMAVGDGAQGVGVLGPYAVNWYRETSLRGTVTVGVYMLLAQAAPTQDAVLNIDALRSGAPVTVHSYVYDFVSGWGRGAAWQDKTSESQTYGSPGTGDKTLVAGAYYSDFPQYQHLRGELAEYSSQGPRVDGADTVDFVAPEDQLTARASPFEGQWGEFDVGGGTSNSAPLAVGVAVLLKQLEPTLSADAWASRLKNRLRTTAQMGAVPNDAWGGGVVSAYRAAKGPIEPPLPPMRPVARGLATFFEEKNELRLDALASSGASGYQWDLDDDGDWDVPLTSDALRALSTTAHALYVRLRVTNTAGAFAETMVPVDTVAPALTAASGTAAKTGCGCASTPGALLFVLSLALLWPRTRTTRATPNR